MPQKVKDDARLLQLLIDDPEEGIRSLQREYGGLILSIAARVLRGYPQNAEEVAADVLAAAWQNAEKLQSQGRMLAPWLTVTTRNRAIDRLRREKRRPVQELDEELFLPGDEDPSEGEELIGLLVEEMPEPDREIFLRRYYRQETTQEIAQKLALTPGAVKMRLSRGREKLRQLYLYEMRKEQEQ